MKHIAINYLLLFILINNSSVLGQNFSETNFINDNSSYLEEPYNTVAGDLDNDGDLDVVCTSSYGDRLSWFENESGVLSEAKLIFEGTTSITPSSDDESIVRLVDYDSDGDLDIFRSRHSVDDINWFENIGSGAFGPAQLIDLIGDGISGFDLADFDGDSDYDFVIADGSSGKVSAYTNLGGGAFSSGTEIASTSSPDAVHLTDLDGDTDIDIIYSHSSEIAWVENLGAGVFASANLISGSSFARSIITADLDNDGDLDIIGGGNASCKFFWIENLGASFGTTNCLHSGTFAVETVGASDLDNDGDLDLVATARKDLFISENTGAGVFSIATSIQTLDEGSALCLGDFNNDGLNDIIAGMKSTEKLRYYKNLGSLNFASHERLLSFGNFQLIAAGDIDQDGDTDVIAISKIESILMSFINDGGTYKIGNIIADDLLFTKQILLADIDGDGDMDIAGCGNTKAYWFENDGTGNFGSENLINNNLLDARAILALDVNQDGKLDLVTASFQDNKVAWFKNLGAGNFGSRQLIANFQEPAFMHAFDADGDGDKDLFVSFNSTSGFDPSNLIALFENIPGAFGPMQTITLEVDKYKGFTSLDVDNDGLDDLVYHHKDGDLATRINLPGSGFDVAEILSTTAKFPFAPADFDTDGDVDLASMSGFNNMAWSKNFGGGLFPATRISFDAIPDGNADMLAIDMDGDGDKDIVSAGQVIVWFENLVGSPNCAAPTGLNAVQMGAEVVQFDWNASPISISHNMQGKKSGSGGSVNLFTSSTDYLVDDSRLETGESYNWRVRSFCATDTSDWSVIGSFTMVPFRLGETENIKLFPNPVKDQLYIILTEQADEVNVEIINASGVIIRTEKIISSQIELNLSELPPGFYLAKINSELKTQTIRFIKK